MQLHHTPTDLAGLPPPEGAHRLAWSYLLDAACADAFHAGVGRLELMLPVALADEIDARRPLPAAPERSDAPLATFGVGPPPRVDAIRHYRLRFGILAPRRLRAADPDGPDPVGFALERTLYVYTLRTRLLGVPMRLLNLLDRPQPADRALIALRHAFAGERPTPAYYRLESWRRAGGGA